METDAALLAKSLADPRFDRSTLGSLIEEIKSLMYSDFSECSVSRIPRVCNMGHVWLEGGKILMREKRCFDY